MLLHGLNGGGDAVAEKLLVDARRLLQARFHMVDGIAVLAQAELLVEDLEANLHLAHGRLVLLHGSPQGRLHLVQAVEVLAGKRVLTLAACAAHGIRQEHVLQPHLVRAVEGALERAWRWRDDARVHVLSGRSVGAARRARRLLRQAGANRHAGTRACGALGARCGNVIFRAGGNALRRFSRGSLLHARCSLPIQSARLPARGRHGRRHTFELRVRPSKTVPANAAAAPR